MALSYSLTSTLNAVLLLSILNKKVKGVYLDNFLKFLLKIIPAAAAMGIVLFFTSQAVDFDASSKIVQISYLALEVVIGASVYFLISIILKVEEAFYICNAILEKVRSFNRKIINKF